MAKRPIIKNNKSSAKRNQNKGPAVNSRRTGGIKKRFANGKNGSRPKAQGESGGRRPTAVRQQQQSQQAGKMQDARQKLMQKKRSKVVDARDVLAKMAKTQDARSKLNKLRQTRGGPSSLHQGGANIKPIGSNILRKTDRNGKISLVTNKTNPGGMNLAIQKELGLVAAGQPKKVIAKRNVSPRGGPTAMRQAVVNQLMNDFGYDSYGPRTAGSSYDASMYKWPKPARPTASQLIGSLAGRARPAPKPEMGGWHHNIAVNRSAMGRMPHQYVDLDAVDDDDDMPMMPMKQTISLQGSSRISNIHSRLDRIQMDPETHGILAQTKTKVVVPAGHRIVVSNLQSTVTQDDVKELFEDIGQLLAARLVRPGVAEVIYKNLKDAQKAVDTYHNRQLDGQPMKCLLVNKRPLNNPTAPPLSKLESQGILKAINVSSSNTSAKLVPDLSTIHKVLFQRK